MPLSNHQPLLHKTDMPMMHSSDIYGLKSQRLIQRLCRLKGGTRVARRLAGFLDQSFFKGRWTALDRDGVKFSLNVNSELEWQILAYGGFDFSLLDILKTAIAKDSVFIDIGANIGCICLPLAKHVGDRGCVLSFEADPAIFKKLQHNTSLNSFAQWRGFNHALGSTPGTLTFHRAANTGSFGHAVGSLYASDWHSGGSTFEVSVDTLDRVLDKDQVNRVDAIKIDVEGAEMDVLRGALQTIERYRPILCLEVCEHTYTSAGWTPQDLFELLSPFGYSFEALDERNPGRTRQLQGPDDRDYLTLVARVS
jgi:FkbM family methyltransferase